MLSKLSISNRLSLFIPIFIVSMAALVIFGLYQLRSSLVAERETSANDLARSAYAIVADWQKKEASGLLTREQAQKGAREQLRQVRYAEDGYFFIYDQAGTSLLTLDPAREGRNFRDAVDERGNRYIEQMLAASRRGGGLVDYFQTKAVGGPPVRKISYVLGFEPWSWMVGTGLYVDDVDAIYRRQMTAYVVLAAGILLLVVGAARGIGLSIRRPLAQITERMGRLAEGDLSFDIPFLDDRHEMGRLARALDVFKINRRRAVELAEAQTAEQEAKLRRQEAVETLIAGFADQATHALETVVSAATQVQTNAGELAELAGTSLDKVAAASRAAGDTTGNVSTIAGAAEELATAVREVNQQVGQSSTVAAQAVTEADRTGLTVRDLTESAARIGNIVSVIQDIASQTNLLALNATIEAARAGDAGKGFAVVAGEVKMLATQTTRATEEIQGQVSGIQAETERAAQAIGSIAKIVGDMRSISSTIATAMEEQDATTREIARHIGEAAEGTRMVSDNIGGVAKAAEITNRAAGELRGASADLQREAGSLQERMTAFFAALRAA